MRPRLITYALQHYLEFTEQYEVIHHFTHWYNEPEKFLKSSGRTQSESIRRPRICEYAR